LVCGRFISFKEGRKDLTLLTFGCPSCLLSVYLYTYWLRESFEQLMRVSGAWCDTIFCSWLGLQKQRRL